jgi:general secretion pathway protein K
MSGTTTAPTRSMAARTAGGALLTVLWLSAALSAIAFSLATTVRGEAERAFTAVDAVRSHYLATGAIQRALLYMEWGRYYLQPDGQSRYYTWGMPRLSFDFPTGHAEVDILPEAAKIDVNSAPPEELFRLLVLLGAEPDRAREITAAILDWRTPAPAGLPTALDQYYLSLTPSFPARHASLEEIEELLLVRGMTPDLFYGSYERDAQGHLVPRVGLRDCVTVYGAGGPFDVNTAEPAVLGAAGLSPDAIALIVEQRNRAPFRDREQLAALLQGTPNFNLLRVGGNAIYTLRSTAWLRLPNGALSDQRRSVAAMVKFMGRGFQESYHVLRWYDDVWAQ